MVNFSMFLEGLKRYLFFFWQCLLEERLLGSPLVLEVVTAISLSSTTFEEASFWPIVRRLQHSMKGKDSSLAGCLNWLLRYKDELNFYSGNKSLGSVEWKGWNQMSLLKSVMPILSNNLSVTVYIDVAVKTLLTFGTLQKSEY